MNKEEFLQWEEDTFGFGYGTGEVPVFAALKVFFEGVPEEGTYDYEVLEGKLGAAVTWLIINILGHDDVIEYGCSPRFAWLTPKGKKLKTIFLTNSVVELAEMVNKRVEY